MVKYCVALVGLVLRVCVCSFVQLFVTPWTIAHQAYLSLEFFRQEYWSGLPFATPENLPNLGIKPVSPVSLTLADGFFTTAPPGRSHVSALKTHTQQRGVRKLLEVMVIFIALTAAVVS